MTSWWSEEVKTAVKLNMKKFRQQIKTRAEEDRLEYVVARNEAKKIKREAKERCWRQKSSDLEADLNGTRKLLYSMGKSYRGKRNEGT